MRGRSALRKLFTRDTSILRGQDAVSGPFQLGPNQSPSFPLCAVSQAILTAWYFQPVRVSHCAEGNILHRHLRPACEELGLPKITWHSLRHCHATLLDAVGAPLGTVQALLGHASSEVTRQIYLHAIPAEQRRAVEGVERLLIGPKWTQVAGVVQRPN
jgi:integrase